MTMDKDERTIRKSTTRTLTMDEDERTTHELSPATRLFAYLAIALFVILIGPIVIWGPLLLTWLAK
jgi:uncharacterized Tic20 family protein